MRKQTIAILGAWVLVLGLAAPAGAAPFVDLTYELSDTTLTNGISECPGPSGGLCTSVDLLGGSMTIRYTSNSASSMPILHGPATLQSLTLRARVTVASPYPTFGTTAPITTAQPLNLNLLSPVAGSLLSGGTLIFGSAQIQATGARHCDGAFRYFPGACIAFAGTLTSAVGPLGPYTTHATLTLAAPAGPYGGAQSTRHTVSGTIPVYAPTKHTYFGLFFATRVNLVGREVLRVADGHPPKVTPEPGTLLLIGSGLAGLAFVGRTPRRR